MKTYPVTFKGKTVRITVPEDEYRDCARCGGQSHEGEAMSKPTPPTPGPWNVVWGNEFRENVLWISGPIEGAIHRAIAEIIGEGDDDLGDHVYNLTDFGNAKLIAAAPDLLEAAKGALQTLDRLPADTLAVPGISRILRAAIAKAGRGEAMSKHDEAAGFSGRFQGKRGLRAKAKPED